MPDVTGSRRIAHLDMDAFFASVELLHYPEIRGQAMVVGGRGEHAPQLQADGSRRFARLKDYVGRGVITTSTYEARAFGVFSGMGMMKAAKLAPDAILLPVNFEAYRRYSRLFKAAVLSVVPEIEDRGIDEIYFNLSDFAEDSITLATRIKQAVREATGLSCSIGITPNKLLSKIASDLQKPDGLTILQMADLPARIWPLSVRKVNGIGPKAAVKLEELGIHTIGELAVADPVSLQEHFGLSYARWLLAAAHGEDERDVVTHAETKSISRETTFERDLHARHDRAELSQILHTLCEQLAQDLKRKGYVAHTIGIKLRYHDFKIATRDTSHEFSVQNSQDILRFARLCLKRVPLEQRLRLLGVRASSLEKSDGAMLPVQAELPWD